jgi:hypothetical protein
VYQYLFLEIILESGPKPFYDRNLCLQRLILSCVGVTTGGVLDRMIESISTLYTPVGTTSSDSVIADIHTLHFTVTHALMFSAFISRIQVADL